MLLTHFFCFHFFSVYVYLVWPKPRKQADSLIKAQASLAERGGGGVSGRARGFEEEEEYEEEEEED
jgi:hypothetical protein